jgi:Xaa-Pro aminopeptidase
VHPLEYAGVSVADKVESIHKQMESKKASLTIFCASNDVVYLLNARAMGDVDTCTVGIAYATVANDQVTGEGMDKFKDVYTEVLKGHIGADTMALSQRTLQDLYWMLWYGGQ